MRWRRKPKSVKCKWCGGRGSYFGHSSLDSLSTFRRARDVTCLYCYGSGKARDGNGAIDIATVAQALQIRHGNSG